MDALRQAQAAIDAHPYPPTHCYDVATLEPRPPLDERLRILRMVAPGMFKARRFLDVGCSKGFFSLLAARESGFVLSIDPDQVALQAWREIKPVNVTQLCCTFGEIPELVTGTFDAIWIGNGHHYLYREDPDYMARLERLACGIVVVEGPVGVECRDMDDFGPCQEEADFLASTTMRLTARALSPSYTPGRAVWCLSKQ